MVVLMIIRQMKLNLRQFFCQYSHLMKKSSYGSVLFEGIHKTGKLLLILVRIHWTLFSALVVFFFKSHDISVQVHLYVTNKFQSSMVFVCQLTIFLNAKTTSVCQERKMALQGFQISDLHNYTLNSIMIMKCTCKIQIGRRLTAIL